MKKGFTPTPERALESNRKKFPDARLVWGFTLLEFLVILGILAVIGAVFVLLLNPAERILESRDAQRIIDLAELKKSLALYVASVAKPNLDSRDNCKSEYKSNSGTTAIDGTGWLPVNFNQIPGGSTIAALPVDPINDADHFYSYRCNQTSLTFELNAKMESKRYQQ